MLFKGLSFLLGVVACFRFPVLPPVWVVAGLPVVVWVGWRYRSGKFPLWLLTWLLGGLLWALLNAHLLLQRELLPGDEGKSLFVEGVVTSLPQADARALRFNFRIDRMDHYGRPIISDPGLVRLSWYDQAQPLRPGARWRLKVRLKRPHGYMNPGGFDYEGWLFQNRLRATGYVVASADNMRLRPAGRFSPAALRYHLRERLQQALGSDPLAGLVPALAVGDRSGLSSAQWDTLSATGTNHLIAISGLHIGLVAGLVYLLMLKCWGGLQAFTTGLSGWARGRMPDRMLDRIPGRLLDQMLGRMPGRVISQTPAIRVAAICAMLAALGYALLAGFALPTQRALIMLWVYFGMKLCNRTAPLGEVLGLALLAALILDPFAAMAASFWLSFGAVAVIFYGIGYRVHLSQRRLREWGRVQYIVTLGLIPALAWYYQQLPVFSLPANLFAVPWVSFIVIPLVLGGCLLLLAGADWLLQLALLSLHVLWRALEFIAAWDFRLLPVAQPDLLTLAVIGIGVLILLLPRGSAPRWLGLVWLAPLFFPAKPGPGFGAVELHVLDVGQGLAAVVRTQNHNLLYDTGPAFPSGFTTGAAVVVPFLRSVGVGALDLLVQSHGDNDHIGGLPAVLEAVPVAQIISSVPEMIPPAQVRPPAGGARIGPDSMALRAQPTARQAPALPFLADTRVTHCRDGQTWRWDGVEFRVLHPPQAMDMSANDRSCVLQVRAGQHTLLLSGDIEQRAEQDLLQRHGAALQADVLVVPHHGSSTSSTPGFVATVAPTIAIFPAGYRNRFGQPHQEVLTRYRERGVALFSTAAGGAIRVKVDVTGITASAHREAQRRFWHDGRR